MFLVALMKFILILLLGTTVTSVSATATATATATEATETTTNRNVKEYYFDAVVDHFNFAPTKEPTFPLRYFVNDDYFNSTIENGCVFFYAGNEANIEEFIENTGILFEISEKFRALVVFVEHRYYGTSKIPWDHTYQFLTVEQAMEDYNTITYHIRQQWSIPQHVPFILFGGSYGANLALWLRLKNPNIWAAAIASSATPLKHILRNTNHFNRIETQVYANVSSHCPRLIRNGWKQLYALIKTDQGRNLIQHELGLCQIPTGTPLNNDHHVHGDDDSNNVATDIYFWISDALETMVQYGYPYPTQFYNPVPAYPFRVACQNMLLKANIHQNNNNSNTINKHAGLKALRAAVDVYYNYTGQAGTCYHLFHDVFPAAQRFLYRKGRRDQLSQQYRYHQSNTYHYHHHGNTATKSHRRLRKQQQQQLQQDITKTYDNNDDDNNDDDNNGNDNDDNAWGYQTCTEVYQPMPTDGITDFEIPYQPNKTEYFQNCRQQFFGVVPRPDWEEMHFMGSDIGITGSNIYLSNGQLDPWRAAGIQKQPRGSTPSSSIIVRTIEGGAHHLDLRASHPLDPPSVTAVRAEQQTMMRLWINQWRELHLSE